MSIDVWAQVAILLIFIHMWNRCGCCEDLGQVAMCLGQVVLWVKLPVQRRLYPIFVSGVGLPDIHEYSAG